MRLLLVAASVLVVAACNAPETRAPDESRKLRFAKLSDDPVEHGKRVASILGCNGCHGKDFAGKDWSEPELGTLWTANLTQSARLYSDDELLTMITTGRRKDRALMDMPSHLFTQVHEDDLRAVLGYLRSMPVTGEVHPQPTIEPKLAEQIKAGEYIDAAKETERDRDVWPPDIGPQHAMARHIVRATCAECHQLDLRGETPPDPELKGSPDLRVVASYDPADFSTLMRTGKASGNREVGLMSEVARNRFSHFTDKEVEAIRSYLVEVAKREP